MPTLFVRTVGTASLAFLAATGARSQDDANAAHFRVLSYPKDSDHVLAEVDGRPIRLEDLARHIDERHYPGFREFLGTGPGNLLLRSDLPAPWVRQLADVRALRAEAAARKVDLVAAEPTIAASLKGAFETWLSHYVENLRANGQPTELTQARVDRLLADFQMKHGLGCEVQGLLDALEPGDYTDEQLRDYFSENARVFGGRVTVAHILIQHRDAGTGILLGKEGLERARTRLAEARAMLRPDGSNFADVAARMSEDSATASKGGELTHLARFDERLPAILARTAWYMKDGEVSDVLESQFGYHIVKRISFSQTVFILFTDKVKPEIRATMRRHRQEDLLFELRKKYGVTLRY